MAVFLARSNLSRGDLRLFLSNENGYQQDAFSVKWTVYSFDGKQVSGKSLPATKARVGEYYAPWFADTANGNYRIEWEVQPDPSVPCQKFMEQFFVVDPSSYQCCPGLVCKDGVPVPGGGTYLTGTMTQRGDLPLFLKNGDGLVAGAFAVFWTIYDAIGNPVSPRTIATSAAFGEYYASWFVDVCSGDYLITWEWMQDATAPLESKSMRFSVVNPPAPYAPIFALRCDGFCPEWTPCQNSPIILASRIVTNFGTGVCEPSPCGCGGAPIVQVPCTAVIPQVPFMPQNSCCILEVARTIHFETQPLPPSGNFTSQPPYIIPRGIRRVTFFLTYTHGAINGYTALRLYWGNGVEETQETLVDHEAFAANPDFEAFQNMMLLDMNGPVPPDDYPVTFTLELGVPGGVTTVRLLACEAGVPGAPGTLGITLTASS